MERGVLTVRDLFNGRFYRIPEYQRGYCWEKQQVIELWEDLVESLESQTPHYLGTVVLSEVKGTKNEYFVVDGQQRLTSLVILMNELIKRLEREDRIFYYRLYLFEGGRFRLEPQVKDKEFFYALLEEKEVKPSSKSQRLMQEAKKEFNRLISECSRNPKELIEKLGEMQVTRFVEKDEGTAIRIFQTVNDRGKPLSFLEKVKSLLIYFSNRYLSGRHDQYINSTFGEIFEKFDEIKSKGGDIALIRSKTFDEDTVMRYHYIIFESKLATYDPTAEFILEVLKGKLRKYRRKGNMSEMANFIEEYISSLHDTFACLQNIVQKVAKKKNYYETFVLLGLSTFLYPLLIALEKRNLLDKEVPLPELKDHTFLDLLRIVDIKVYKTRGTNPRAEIYRLAHKIFHEPKFSEEEIAYWLVEYVKRWMPQEEFSLRLQGNIYGNAAVPYLLLKYSEHLRGRPYSLEDLKNLKSLNLTVEHVLAKHPNFSISAYGFDDEEDFMAHENQLGNLTLLSENLNKQASNRAPLEKVHIYDRENSLLEITHRLATIIRTNRTFEKKDIIRRTREIFEFIKEFVK
jgi:uncharacterized protein with ParB-like and HNH nuclease domain